MLKGLTFFIFMYRFINIHNIYSAMYMSDIYYMNPYIYEIILLFTHYSCFRFICLHFVHCCSVRFHKRADFPVVDRQKGIDVLMQKHAYAHTNTHTHTHKRRGSNDSLYKSLHQ